MADQGGPAGLRRSYERGVLLEAEADPDPVVQFGRWFEEAAAGGEIYEPNAMMLATVGADGRPACRAVLLKGFDERGFTFYTNLESRKAEELAANPYAALLFWWDRLHRQVRVEGPVEFVEAAEADAYFASRPYGSRIGAWASQQSRPLESRFALEKAVAGVTAKYPIGEIPRPPYWSGFRITPLEMEFWHDRPFRLHERVAFRRASPAEAWSRSRLYP